MLHVYLFIPNLRNDSEDNDIRNEENDIRNEENDRWSRHNIIVSSLYKILLLH